MAAEPLLNEEIFARMISRMMSAEELTPERTALMKQIGQALASNPDFLEQIDQIREQYAEKIAELQPSEEELASFGWNQNNIEDLQREQMKPAHAAAALAPAAAAMAAAPVPI